MTSPVTPVRAREIIAAYGAAPQRWPAPERDAVLALAATDAELTRLLEDARALDALLDATPAPPEIAVNPVAILAAARRGSGGGGTPGTGTSSSGAAPRLRWRIAGMAAAAVIGFVVGVTGIAPLRAPLDRDDAAAAFAAMIEEEAL